MFRIRVTLSLGLFAIVLFGLAGCDQIASLSPQETGITASGVVEATEVTISPDMAGRVAEVFVMEGDSVEPGDKLFRLENELLFAQRRQAAEALETARVNREIASDQRETAQAGVDLADSDASQAQIQYQIALDAARQAERPARQLAWELANPEQFDTPAWFFEQSEQIEAAQTELEVARTSLDDEERNLDTVTQEAGSADLLEAENRLADAQAAFLVATELRDRPVSQGNEDKLDTYIQDLYDSANVELERATNAYETLLSDEGLDEILEARSRVAAAQERLNIAQDRMSALMTGDKSFQVQLAAAAVDQAVLNVSLAQSNLKQAETAIRQADQVIAQAQAGLDLIDVQIDQLTTRATESGTVTARLVEPGETVQPGATAMMVSQLDHLTVTVYIPEDQYGKVDLGDHAKISSDSFPGIEYDSQVIRIADQAEFTPRNVQTAEDRKTTVFAIDLEVLDQGGSLKPGMPVSIIFQ